MRSVDKHLNERLNRRQYNAAMTAFFLSGCCAISSGIVVSILRDMYQFSFSFSGTLISVMSIGNMTALLFSGILPGVIGQKATTLMFCSGYCLGYGVMALTGNPVLLLMAFFFSGASKGGTANICTNLVGKNAKDRSRGLSLMNAWFSLGALLCPFLISFLQKKDDLLPMAGISFIGLCLWLTFLNARIPGKDTISENEKKKGGYSFLKNPLFWMLAMLLFCQNGAEYTVNGWLVTYYKNEQILTGAAAAYTVTLMWITSLVARLLLAFCFKIRKPYKLLSAMGAALTVMYLILLQMHSAVPALIVLGLLSFALAGVYPMAVASLGELTSPASVGIILALGGIGGILFPWLVGIVADVTSLRFGMAVNLIPCTGIIILPFLISARKNFSKE